MSDFKKEAVDSFYEWLDDKCSDWYIEAEQRDPTILELAWLKSKYIKAIKCHLNGRDDEDMTSNSE